MSTSPQTPNLLSVDDFAAKIKAKYPDYSGMGNNELTQKMLEKYPEYKNQVNLVPDAGLSKPALPVPAGLQDDLTHRHDTNPIAQNPGVRSDMTKTGDLKKPGFLPSIIRNFLPDDEDNEEMHRLHRATSPEERQAILNEYHNRPLKQQFSEEIPVIGPNIAAGMTARERFKQDRGSEGAGYSLAAAVPLFGPAAANIGEKLGQKDFAGGMGDLTALGIQSALVKASPDYPASKSTPIPSPLSRVVTPAPTRIQRIENLKNAVNPVPGEVPGFLKNSASQFDTIARHAGEKGTPIKSVRDFADVSQSAAEADPYRKTYIEPYAGEDVSTTGIKGYSGESVDHGRASIAQLDARLGTINDMLSPKYARGPEGSLQQSAALGAEQAAGLQAEARGIRNTLAQEIGKRAGVDPQVVAQARRNYGQLKDTADTARYYADEAQRTANKQSQGPVDTHLTALGVVNKVVNKLRGNPADKLVQKAFEGYEPPPPGQIPLTPPSSPKPPRTPFYKRGGGSASVPSNASGSPVSASPQANLTPIPSIPASNPSLLRPGGGEATPSTPLPFGPTAASAPVGEVTGRTMPVGEEFPQISGTGNLPQIIQELLTGGAQKALPPPSFIPLRSPVSDIPIPPSSPSRPSLINPLAGRPIHTLGHLPGPVRFLKNDLSALIDSKERISVIDPKTGNKGTVPRGQVDQALKEGFRLAQ